MSESSPNIESTTQVTDRRMHPRYRVNSILYIELGEDNGGTVVDMGEGGLCVQAVADLAGSRMPRMRFRRPRSGTWIEPKGRITWIGKSGKVAGIEFVELSPGTEAQLRECLSVETTRGALAAVPRPGVAAAETASARMEASEIIGSEQAQSAVPPASEPPTPAGAAEDSAPPASQVPDPADYLNQIVSEHVEDGATARSRLRRLQWVLAAVLSILVIAFELFLWNRGARIESAVGQIGDAASQLSSTVFGLGLPPVKRIPPPFELEVADARDHRWLVGSSGLPFALDDAPGQHSTGSSDEVQQSSSARNESRTTDARAARAGNPSEIARVPLRGSASCGGSSLAPAPKPAELTTDPIDGRLVYWIEPTYPTNVARSCIEGTVKLRALIGGDGIVRSLQPVSGPAVLFEAAMSAARAWRFEAAQPEGKDVATEGDINVVFRNIVSRIQ